MLVRSYLIASRISRNVVRPPDQAWPYGYEGQEALYVLPRSLVLAVSQALLREPLAALRDAMAQAAGCAADPDVLQRTRMALLQELVGLQLQMMDFTVQQLGRTGFVLVYINPLQPQESLVIDGLRYHIDARCSAELGRSVRSEVILTVMPPIHRKDSRPQTAP